MTCSKDKSDSALLQHQQFQTSHHFTSIDWEKEYIRADTLDYTESALLCAVMTVRDLMYNGTAMPDNEHTWTPTKHGHHVVQALKKPCAFNQCFAKSHNVCHCSINTAVHGKQRLLCYCFNHCMRHQQRPSALATWLYSACQGSAHNSHQEYGHGCRKSCARLGVEGFMPRECRWCDVRSDDCEQSCKMSNCYMVLDDCEVQYITVTDFTRRIHAHATS